MRVPFSALSVRLLMPFFFFLPPMAYSTVQLTIPEEIQLYVANGDRIEHSFFSSPKSIELPNGLNQIVFRYQTNFRKRDQNVKFLSQAIVATFNAKDTELTFQLPQYQDEETAKNFNSGHDWSLVSEKGNKPKINQALLEHHGTQFGRDFQQEVLEYNKKGGSAAIVLLQSTKKELTEQELYLLYKKATPSQQKSLKARINNQQ